MRADPKKKELDFPTYEENAIACLRLTAAPGQNCITIHWHERFELIRVSKGTLTLCLNEQTYPLCAGQLAIICPRQTHEGIAGPEGAACDVVMFELLRFSNQIPAIQSLLHAMLEGRLLFDPITDDPQVIASFDSILHAKKDAIYQSISGIYALLGQMLEACNPRYIDALPSDSQFAKVVDYVDEHFLEPLSTARICALFSYNKSYFCRRFKQHTSLPLMRYVEVLRLERARLLLQTSADPVSKIALQSGFSDLCYFSQRFHNHFGLSPSNYRKQMQGTAKQP